jgi:YebC/PmpR family DNA-binding regulatory protein
MGRAFEYRRASKEKRWDKMSRIFPKLSKAITIAAKEGGSDPEANGKLRSAIMNAKAENMPKDNIDNAIARASGKDAEDMKEIVYEGKGPHGVMIVVECATDNGTRTVANVKNYFSKAGGGMVPTGSFEFLFSRKAVFEVVQKPGIDLEELEFSLIDAGLEEIEAEEGTIYIYGPFTAFGTLSKAIDDLKLEVTKSSLQRIPNSAVEFTEEQLVDIEKLIDRIEEDEDVQSVFTNIG